MNDILKRTNIASASRLSVSDLKQTIIFVQNSFNVSLVDKSNSSKIDTLLRSVWKFLLYCAIHYEQDIRIAAQRATGMFLLRSSPFFPQLVSSLIAEASFSEDIPNPSAILFVISSFSIYTNYVFPNQVESAKTSFDVLSLFSSNEPIVMEYLSIVIDNLKHMDQGFYSSLLEVLIKRVKASTDRFLFRAIVSILKKMPVLLSFLETYVKLHESDSVLLVLFSYILSTDIPYINEFDLFSLAKISMGVLESPPSVDIADASFAILSSKSKSFKLEISIDSKAEVTMSVSKNTEKISTIFKLSKYSSHPSVFLLPLPLEYVLPNEVDGILSLTSKFTSITNLLLNSTDKSMIDQLFSFFVTFINKPYNEMTSVCLRSLSKCIGTFVNFVKRSDIIDLIQSILFCEKVNWYHSSDVVKFASSLISLGIDSFIGYSKTKYLVSDIILNSRTKSDELWKESCAFLTQYSRFMRPEFLCFMIFEHLDIFDSLSYNRLLDCMSLILDMSISIDSYYLYPLIIAVFESLTFYSSSMQIISSVFRFLTHFDLSIVSSTYLNSISIISYSVSAVLHYISGFYQRNRSNSTQVESLLKDFSQYFENQPFELLSEGVRGISDIFCVVKYGFDVLNSVEANPNLCSVLQCITEHSIILFPMEIIRVITKFWPLLTKNDQTSIINMAIPYLKNQPNLDNAAQWIRIILDPSNTNLIPLNSPFQKAFFELIYPAISVFHDLDKKSIVLFTEFAVSSNERKEELNRALNELDENQKRAYFQIIRNQNSSLVREITDNPPEALPEIGKTSFLGAFKDITGMGSKVAISIKDRVIKRMNRKTSIETRNLMNELLLSSEYQEQLDSPIVLTQLKFNTLEFKLPQLKKLLEGFIEQVNIEGILLVVKYMISHSYDRSLNSYQYPKESIPEIIRHLHLSESRFINSFIRKFALESTDTSIQCALHCSEPVAFATRLLEKEKIRRVDVLHFCKVLCLTSSAQWHSKLPFESENLYSIVNRCLQVCEAKIRNNKKSSQSWLHISLLLSVMYAHSVTTLDQSFYEPLLRSLFVCCTNFPDSIFMLSLLLLKISEKAQDSSILKSYANGILQKIDYSSTAMGNIVILNIKNGFGFDCSPISALASMLNSKMPSEFANGLQLFASISPYYTLVPSLNFLKNDIATVTSNLPNYYGIPSVMHGFGALIESLTSYETCNELVPPFVDFVSNIKKIADMTDLFMFGKRIPHMMISPVTWTSARNSLFKQMQKLFRIPPSYSLFSIYLDTFRFYLSSQNSPQNKLKVLDEYLPTFYLHLPMLDNVRIADMILGMAQLMSEVIDAYSVTKRLLLHFYPNSPRFFPFFVSFVRFVDTNQLRSSSSTKKEMRKIVKSSMSTDHCRVHYKAIFLLFKEGMEQHSSRLAVFVKDTEESDTIIASIQGKRKRNRVYEKQ